MASTTSAATRPTLTGSELASTSARTTWGSPRPAATTSSRVRARSICAADRERRVAADVHQIGRRHDPGDRPVRARHREVVHPFGEHGQQRLADQGVLGQRLHGERRDLLDGSLRAPMRRQHARTQIAVGHDAPPVAHRDEEARDVLGRHALGGDRHGHPGIRRDRSSGGPTRRPGGTGAPAAPSPRARRPAARASCPGRTTVPRTCPGSRRRRRRRSGSRACPRAPGPSTSGSPPPATRTARTPRRRSRGRRAGPPRSARRRPCAPRRGIAPVRPTAPGSRRRPGSARSRRPSRPARARRARARRTAGIARGTSPRPRREYAAAGDGALARVGGRVRYIESMSACVSCDVYGPRP